MPLGLWSSVVIPLLLFFYLASRHNIARNKKVSSPKPTECSQTFTKHSNCCAVEVQESSSLNSPRGYQFREKENKCTFKFTLITEPHHWDSLTIWKPNLRFTKKLLLLKDEHRSDATVKRRKYSSVLRKDPLSTFHWIPRRRISKQASKEEVGQQWYNRCCNLLANQPKANRPPLAGSSTLFSCSWCCWWCCHWVTVPHQDSP